MKMNPSQNQRKEAGSSGVGGSSALTNQVVDQEMRVVQNENNAYTDDPNEAVKEVLRQILDEESKKNNAGGHYGLSVGGLSSIPKYTKDIIKQEILHEKLY